MLASFLPLWAAEPKIEVAAGKAALDSTGKTWKVPLTAKVTPEGHQVEWSRPVLGSIEAPVAASKGEFRASYALSDADARGIRGGVRVCATVKDSTVAACTSVVVPAPSDYGGPVERLIVGYEQSGASAAQTAGRFFFDALLTRPIGIGGRDPLLGPHLRTWGNFRITSVPQQISSPVVQFAADLSNQIGQLKVNEIAQGAEILFGVECRFLGFKGSVIPVLDNGRVKTSVSVVGAAGAITPLNPKDGTEVYYAPQQGSDALVRLMNFYGALSNQGVNVVVPPSSSFPPHAVGAGPKYNFVGLVPLDRQRFYRQWYGGLRFQTHYLDDSGMPKQRPPQMFDLLFGRNELVTGGRLSGVVARIEAFYPLPFRGRHVYFFGNLVTRLKRDPGLNEALILDKAVTSGAAPEGRPQFASLAAPDVNLMTVPASNRDVWRVGFGIDLVRLLATWWPDN